VVAVTIGILAACGSGTTSPAATPEHLSAVVAGNNEFAADLYSRLSKQEGNLFFSPNSISTALAMTYAGAGGNTQTEMKEVLHFPLDNEPLHACFNELTTQLQRDASSKAGYRLSIANRLWGQTGYPFNRTFLRLTKAHYGAELAQVDFETNTEAARQLINSWVEKKTERKIKDLLAPGILDPLTRLVLTNAIYFKGDWAKEFNEEATEEQPFHITPEKTVNVPMMHQSTKFRYMENDDIQALEMNYKGDALSMMVLLPKEQDGLASLERALSANLLKQWADSMQTRKVDVYLPKFKLESKFSLKETLAAMGMADAFDPMKADFSGMTAASRVSGTDPGLYISAVIHKAYVDVNEEGTEAAAATAVVMRLAAAPEEPPVFRADHPFLFLIRDNRSGSILFIGRMVNPT
jgi:serpin B